MFIELTSGIYNLIIYVPRFHYMWLIKTKFKIIQTLIWHVLHMTRYFEVHSVHSFRWYQWRLISRYHTRLLDTPPQYSLPLRHNETEQSTLRLAVYIPGTLNAGQRCSLILPQPTKHHTPTGWHNGDAAILHQLAILLINHYLIRDNPPIRAEYTRG
jgi:hypothetical protein